MTAGPPVTGRRAALGAAVVAVGLGLGSLPIAGPVLAQSLSVIGGDANTPIEIYAEDGIEWQQEKQLFLARGNARAVRGEVEVRANVLTAYYRETPNGGTDIWRLHADGGVRISSPGEKAYGEKGVYDVDNGILVLSGGRVRLVTKEDEITADRQLEYWEKKQMAVARGNASAVRGDKRLRADVLAAYFRKDKNGRSAIYRVEAFDNVRIKTAKDDARADRAVYNVQSGIVTLAGSVKIIRGRNQLRGCRAEINLNTGISKLFGCGPPGSGGEPVRGVIQPVKKK